MHSTAWITSETLEITLRQLGSPQELLKQLYGSLDLFWYSFNNFMTASIFAGTLETTLWQLGSLPILFK
jgi:hypothetical protein